MLNGVMLCVAMLSVIMLSVIMLIVVAPLRGIFFVHRCLNAGNTN